MRILMVNDYKAQIGGAEIYMHTLKNELEKRGNQVGVFSSSISKKEYIQNLSRKDYFRMIKQIFNPLSLYDFRKKIAYFKPDIIHIHGLLNELTPSILLATNNLPVIMTVHNNLIVNSVVILSERTGKECRKRTCSGCLNCKTVTGVAYEFFRQPVLRGLLKKTDLYITPSNYMRKLLLEANYSPVKHIPNGFIPYRFSKIINFNRLLYVGRLSPEKGIEYLIRAMPAILQSKPSTVLQIVGDGPNKNSLQEMITAYDLQQSVSIISDIGHNEVKQYYDESTIVIVPSIYNDNLPTVCIEALSIGRPLIGTKMGGIPELIDHNKTGLLVDPKDSEQIAQAVLKILSNEKLIHQMSRNAYEKSKKYDINIHLNKIEEIYKELIRNKK